MNKLSIIITILAIPILGYMLINSFTEEESISLINIEPLSKTVLPETSKENSSGVSSQMNNINTFFNKTDISSPSLLDIGTINNSNYSEEKTNIPTSISDSSLSSPDSTVTVSINQPTKASELKSNSSIIPQGLDENTEIYLNNILSQSDEPVQAIDDFLQSLNYLSKEERLEKFSGVEEETLKVALYRTLEAAGGDNALRLLENELENASNPHQISKLASILEQQAPNEFQTSILSAATRSLKKVLNGDFPNVDPRPLFQTFSDYGNTDTVTQLLAYNDDWDVYKAVALGQAPEGVGIAGLNQLLQESKSPSTSKVALQMLAQESSRHLEAQDALVEQVQLNNIPNQDWKNLALALTGSRQYQLENPLDDIPLIDSNNKSFPHEIFGVKNSQTIYLSNVKKLTYDEVVARLSVIDILTSVSQNSVAIQELENARQQLSQLIP